MGRPIKSRFFGTAKGSGTGGEGVSLVTIDTNPVSTLTVTVIFEAPQIPGGVTATGSVVKPGNTVTSVTVLTAGSGYTSAPSVTFTGTNMTTIGSATATLTTVVTDNIFATAFLTTGSSAVTANIQEQVGSKEYRVQTAQGLGHCTLVTTSTLIAGQMFIGATDANGSTYFVKKLTARRAVLVQRTVNGSFAFSTNSAAGWTIDSASAGVVVIDNR
jgi:hypothetical protein